MKTHWKHPDDVKVGDVLIGFDRSGREVHRTVVGFGTRFNPSMQPVRFEDDPYCGVDLDRTMDVQVIDTEEEEA